MTALNYPLQHSLNLLQYLSSYTIHLSIICCSICSITLPAISHLLIQAAVFHSAREITNILTIANSKKLLAKINTDSLRERS